jgi:hypothetical protein
LKSKKKKPFKKPDSVIIGIVALLILIIARNIDFIDLSNSEFSYKTLIYVIIMLLSVVIAAFIIKDKDKDED